MDENLLRQQQQKKKDALKRLNSMKQQINEDTPTEIHIASIKDSQSRTVAERISIGPKLQTNTIQDERTIAKYEKPTTINNHGRVILKSNKISIMEQETKSFTEKPRRPLVGLVDSRDYIDSDMKLGEDKNIHYTMKSEEKICTSSVASSSTHRNMPTLSTADNSYNSYLHPPKNPSGIVVDLSDRPLICSAVNQMTGELIVGGADHAVYSVKFNEKSKISSKKQMYTKKYGHTDWVTSVAFTSDSRVISSCMDGKLCLWDNTRNTCIDIIHHKGSVTKVITDVNTNTFCSGGYDGKIFHYNISSTAATGKSTVANSPVLAQCLQGHKAPIIDISYHENNSNILGSGARDGDVYFWDLTTSSLVKRYHGHQGSVTKILPFSNNSYLFISCGVDGCVKVYDQREKNCVINILISHSTDKGVASIGTMTTISSSSESGSGSGTGTLVITGSSDNSITVTDLRMTTTIEGDILKRWNHHHNSIFSLCTIGENCLFSGDGQGMMLCYNLYQSNNDKALCYGLSGCENGAVQSILHLRNSMIACGDSGKLLIYEY